MSKVTIITKTEPGSVLIAFKFLFQTLSTLTVMFPKSTQTMLFILFDLQRKICHLVAF